uniref:Uncharacterized protein n=1 Tax=Trichuris muris TaxID=70415 RepID=A0A5S6QJ62_TRIMR
MDNLQTSQSVLLLPPCRTQILLPPARAREVIVQGSIRPDLSMPPNFGGQVRRLVCECHVESEQMDTELDQSRRDPSWRSGTPADLTEVDLLFASLGGSTLRGSDEILFSITTEESTERALRALWQLDAIGITDVNEKDDCALDALKQLQETISFDRNRYKVRLPWKGDKWLPNNYCQAHQRLTRLENHVEIDTERASVCACGMQEYITNEWVEKADHPVTIGSEWYLPHHPVIRHDKTALNDLLETGPPLPSRLSWNSAAVQAL